MKDENKNLDAFFSGRLQNETVGDDDWNMPSDDIWNAAKPKFIDRKKKKKRFLFWLMIPFLAFCISVPLKLIEGLGVDLNDSELVQLEGIQNGKIEASTQIDNSDQGRLASQNQSGENQVKSDEDIEYNVLQSNQSDVKEIQKKPESKPNINREFNNIDDKNSSKEYLGRNEILNEISLITEIKNEEKAEHKKEVGFDEIEQEVFGATMEGVAILPSSINRIVSNSDSIIKIESLNIDIKKSNFILPITRPIYRNEIGLSHSQLLFNLLLEVDLTSENELDEFNFSQNYFNANISGRKWINRKWSFLTGLQYSNLYFNLDFSVYNTLDKELMKFINEEFNDATSRSALSDQEVDFVIDLKDGVDVKLGDLLNIQVDFSQRIRAIQMPFFLDYHINRRKMEYIFGMGVTLEYIRVSETSSDFKIFRDNELISKPVNLPSIFENYIDGSVYIKSGVRYSLSDQFNFGIDAKVNLSSIIFSGIDAGIYYRW